MQKCFFVAVEMISKSTHYSKDLVVIELVWTIQQPHGTFCIEVKCS